MFLSIIRNNVVLKNRDFMLLLMGKAVSQTGNWIYYLGIVYYVAQLTDSTAHTGFVLFCNAAPAVLFGSIAGSLCDRYSRKYILIIADAFNGALSLYLGIRALMGTATLAEVYVIAFGIGIGKIFFNPALSASIPSVVEPQNLNRANSLINFTASITTIIGPLFGGLLIAFIGSSLAFTLNGISFIISALFELFVHIPQERRRAVGNKARLLWSDVKEGATYIIGNRIICGVLIVFSIMTLFISPIVIYLHELTENYYDTNSLGLSGIFVADAIGVLLASLYLIVHPLVRKQRDMVMLFPIFCGLSLIIISQFTNYYVALVVMFLQGFIAGFGEISLMTILQKETPDHKRGMIFSLYSMVLLSMEPVSLLACGWIIEHFAVTSVLTTCGVILIGGGFLLYMNIRRYQPAVMDVKVRESAGGV
jgi:MFS transporter, DHA3 family, macrolide efflux protein